MHDYTTRDTAYVEMTGIYQKIYYKKQGTYGTTEVLTNGTVQIQWGQVNKRINIRRLDPHFDE